MRGIGHGLVLYGALSLVRSLTLIRTYHYRYVIERPTVFRLLLHLVEFCIFIYLYFGYGSDSSLSTVAAGRCVCVYNFDGFLHHRHQNVCVCVRTCENIRFWREEKWSVDKWKTMANKFRQLLRQLPHLFSHLMPYSRCGMLSLHHRNDGIINGDGGIRIKLQQSVTICIRIARHTCQKSVGMSMR